MNAKSSGLLARYDALQQRERWLIALGVLGGILVFGFIGIFLGPVLLALGHMLLSRWTRDEDAA